MATSPSKRDVRLGVSVETSGEDDLANLGKTVRDVGAAAGESTPQIDRMARELDALTAATKERRVAEDAARTDAAAAKRALGEQQDALAKLKAETDRAGKATAEYEARERALRVAVVDVRAALRERTAAVTAAADASRTAATAEAEHEAALRRAIAQQRASVTASKEQSTALDDIRGKLNLLSSAIGAAYGGTLIGAALKSVADLADGYNGLAARVKLATGEGAAFDAVFQGIQGIAARTGTSLESVGALVTKLVNAGKEIGVTNQQALQLAETITQSLALSGATAQESASAVLQLGQALASGKLAGDELKSILEGAPALAKALADGLGIAVGQLKELGSAGALSSQQVVQALLGQSQAIDLQFKNLPLSVTRATTLISNAWEELIGRTDKATGASHAAAEALAALARNLDTVANVLFGAGKAAAALAAVRLADYFIASAAGARTAAAATLAATAATTAHTAAATANTAAQTANVAAAGRLAGILGTLKTLSLLGVVTNFREIGTAIGEWVAKATGADKALQDLERSTRADEAAARADAAARDALAQATQRAADAALGLTKESKAIVAEFDKLTAKGDGAAEALGKVAKGLDLSDVRGIAIAGAALDALALRGKITADQLRETLGTALKGADLGVFATLAAAAFDNSVQGARRLKAALDAVADESLRRVGSSLQEVQSGFSEAASKALNDVDALRATVDNLGLRGDAAGRLLAKAVDQATAAANTERAVDAVRARVEALGAAGLLTGDRLADALTKARTKADDLRGGVNSLDQALRTFGLKTKAELQATADKLGEAYLRIAGNAQVSLQDQAQAFAKWRDAALAASGGVETGQLGLQRRILENRLAVQGLGTAIESSMARGAKATDAATAAQERYNAALRADPSRLVGGDGLGGIRSSTSSPADKPSTIDSFGNLIRSTTDGGITRTATGQIDPPDQSGNWEFVNDGRGVGPRPTDRGVPGVGYWTRTAADRAADATRVQQAPVQYITNVTLDGNGYRIGTTDKQSADALLALLEQAKRTGG